MSLRGRVRSAKSLPVGIVRRLPGDAGRGANRRPARRRTKKLLVASAMLLPIGAMWFGLAALYAHRLRFPPFYHPHGDVDAESSGPTAARGPDPRTACGVDFQELRLRRSDGLMLGAWFVPASKPAAVILLHPARGDRRFMLPYLNFIHAAGYPALLLDTIGAGSSEGAGSGVGYGWRERDDVLSAASALRALGFERIGALGLSSGAAAALLAGSPPLAAIVSDSAFANLGALFRGMPSLAELNPLFTSTVLWETGLGLGRAPDRIAPARAAARLKDCAILVIHGAEDRMVPVADAVAIFKAAPEPKELWIVEQAGHLGAFQREPKAYAQRVTSFLDRYLARPARERGAPE